MAAPYAKIKKSIIRIQSHDCAIGSWRGRVDNPHVSRSNRINGRLVVKPLSLLCTNSELQNTCTRTHAIAINVAVRFYDEYDYEYEIFSILSSARP